MSRFRFCLLTVLATLGIPFPAEAQQCPEEMIRLVSPRDGASTAAESVTVRIVAGMPLVVSGSDFIPAGTTLKKGEANFTRRLRRGRNTFVAFISSDGRPGSDCMLAFALNLDLDAPRFEFYRPSSGSVVAHSPVEALYGLNENVTVVSSSPGFLKVGPLDGGERGLVLPLTIGMNEFTATLRDEAGNETVYAGPSAFRFTLAPGRPAPPKLTAPADGSHVAGPNIPVTGTVSENTEAVVLVGARQVFAIPVKGRFNAVVPVSAGRNRIRAFAVSAADIRSEESSVVVNVDTGTARVADSELSFLRPKGTGCELVRFDAGKRTERGLATLEGPCRGWRYFWSPDGARAALVRSSILSRPSTSYLWWSSYEEPASAVIEVDLVQGKAGAVSLTGLGPVHTLSYDRYGRMQASSVDVDTTKSPAWFGRTFSRESGTWKKQHESRASDRAGLTFPSPRRAQLGDCYNDNFPSTTPVAAAESARLDAWAGMQSERGAKWVRLAPASPFVVRYENVVPISADGNAMAILIGGMPTALEGFKPEDRGAPDIRGSFLLVVSYASPMKAKVYDTAANALLWSSDEVEQPMFWPRFAGCDENERKN